MRWIINSFSHYKTIPRLITIGFFLIFYQGQVDAQENPPRPIGLSLGQTLNFGAIFQGSSGGTVIIFTNGTRSSTGDIVLVNLGFLYCPAMFELEGELGTIVHVLYDENFILTGPSGSTMMVKLSESEPGDPIILTNAPPNVTEVFIGGTLFVGTPVADPPGYYTGSFTVTFVQE